MQQQPEGKWEQKADMLTERMWSSCTEVDEKIYVIGGLKHGTNW